MTAVFTRTEEQFKYLGLTPKQEFIRIKEEKDLRGYKFTGVIRTSGWWESDHADKMEEAYKTLKSLQPNLFD